MVIDPSNNSNIQNNVSSRARQTVPANKPESDTNNSIKSSPTSSDSVSLSSEGQTMAKVATELSNTPDVDSAKVAQLKAAIENGSYSVNAEQIAESMLEQDEMFS